MATLHLSTYLELAAQFTCYCCDENHTWTKFCTY